VAAAAPHRLELRIRCVDSQSIVRIIDWVLLEEQIGGCDSPYGFMVDPEQVKDILRFPSLRERLLRLSPRLFTYPCITEELVKRLELWGFKVINYVTSDDCFITDAVVTVPGYPLNVEGEIYVHIYEPFNEGCLGHSIQDLRGNRYVHLIIDMLHSS